MGPDPDDGLVQQVRQEGLSHGERLRTALARPSAGAPSPRRAAPCDASLGPDWQLGWLLVAPVVLHRHRLLIYPFIDAILLSFQERFIGKTGTWVGLANYAALFADATTPWVESRR